MTTAKTGSPVDSNDGARRPPGRPSGNGAAWLVRLAFLVPLVASASVMFVAQSGEAVGVAGIVMLLTLMLAKVPVGVSLTVPGLVGLQVLYGEAAVANVLGSMPFESVAQWTLSVLPMFVLMGLLLYHSGLSTRIYTAATDWLGWLPGGLGVATIGAGAGLASVSGSSVGTTHALARIGVPEMLARGYSPRVAIGTVSVASLPGHLIPPSILLVVFAGVAEVEIGPLLMAGVGPGLLIASSCALTVVVVGTVRRSLVGRGAHPSTGRPGGDAELPNVAAGAWKRRWHSARDIWPLPVLVGIVLGSMFTGIFTATEAGAAGAFGALVYTLWSKRRAKPLHVVSSAVDETVRAVGAIFFLLVGGHIFSQLIAVSGLATEFSRWVVALELGRVEFLLIMVVAYLVMGMFMDGMAMILLTVPLLMPALVNLDISLLWFGPFVVLMAEVAILTPPLGMLSFVIHKIVQDPAVNLGQRITLGDVFRSIAWFMPVIIGVVVILIAFPDIATHLGDRM